VWSHDHIFILGAFFVGGRGGGQIVEVEAVPVATPRLGEQGASSVTPRHGRLFGLGLAERMSSLQHLVIMCVSLMWAYRKRRRGRALVDHLRRDAPRRPVETT
jgi:hypothetical protein